MASPGRREQAFLAHQRTWRCRGCEAEAIVRDVRAFAKFHVVGDFGLTCDSCPAVYGPEGQPSGSARADVDDDDGRSCGCPYVPHGVRFAGLGRSGSMMAMAGNAAKRHQNGAIPQSRLKRKSTTVSARLMRSTEVWLSARQSPQLTVKSHNDHKSRSHFVTLPPPETP